QRAENDMPGEGSLHGNLRGFQIPDFSHQDLVRVLPQNRSQRRGKGYTNLRVDRHLDDAVHVIFDRVFSGDDLLRDLVELIEGRIQGGGLARAGRPGDQDDAIGLANQFPVGIEDDRLHPNLVEIELDDGAVQDADDDAFAEHGGQDTDAHIHGVAADVELDTAVLRQAALGNVQV